MATSSRFQVYVLAFCATLLIQSGCYGHSVHQRKHAALFIFGGSTFDVGNNNYINTSNYFKANFFPYGETFFSHPTGRFSDGRLISDIIAEYADLPMIPPYLQPGFDNYTNGVNFASAGAGALAETHQGFALDLKTQLGYFKNVEKQLRHRLGEVEAHTLLSQAVYLIAIGSNDYVAFITNSSSFESRSHEEYVGMVTGNITNVIKEIYKKGGRKFGIKGIENLGCIPGLRTVKPGNTSTCNEEVNAISKLHNRVLAKVLEELKGQLQDFIYSNPNFYSYANDVVNNPSKHGFKEGKMACCGSGPYRGISSCGGKRGGMTEYQLCDNVTDYVYFDSGHPTERYNQKLSKLWWSHTPDVTARYFNLKELFEV
ncbi:putative SGNH hydrolase-type esterase domain-containing protein [Rosa chinensis]|uniref:Putative SGNH hydrolase-type esterase domain-containing protein n=1 Tax=Rosa chinensis TaxID=74649 RepID=A0A2P6PEW2_ROSCH|nr:GDSL lipase [Rosa chinensis]PRQ20461.1 putative SGNH hydrolase-type esterase domain-containing protein [Rosa chinensis]